MGGINLMVWQMWQSLSMHGTTTVPAFMFMGEVILHSSLGSAHWRLSG
jgi:hypothetical protein